MMHPYQLRAVEHALATPKCAIWAEPGLGKSLMTLKTIEALLDQVAVAKVLVVAPLRVATNTWPAEIKKWGLRLTYSLVTGTVIQRAKALDTPADVYLINYENLAWLVKLHARKWPWDMIVLDESSKAKNKSTRRWQSLSKIRSATTRMIQLTGTPAANGLLDLWAQIHLLDNGQRLGRTLTVFREKWFTPDYLGYNWTPKPGADLEIYAAVADLVLTLRAEDYLQMPDYVPVTVAVPLPPQARKTYERLEKDLYLELSAGDVTAASAASLSIKCRELCNGHLYTDDGAWEEIHTAKLEALADLVEEAAGEPLLVAYSFKADLERLRNRFPQARVLDKNPQTIIDWNAGRIPMLLAQTQSASHGLNLQQGGHLVVWFGLDWSLELYQQFNARLYRQGQTRPVFVYHLLAEDTVDGAILERLRSKRTVQDCLMAALTHSV